MNHSAIIFITHDIDRTDYLDFILTNLQSFRRISSFEKYFVHLHSSGENSSERIDLVFKKLKLDVKNYCNIELHKVANLEEKKEIYSSHLGSSKKIVQFDSDVLLSRYFFLNLLSPQGNLLEYQENLFFPVIKYKYEYKNIEYGTKQSTVRNFIKSTNPYFQSGLGDIRTYNPDWDERLYVNHSIMEKMNNMLPVAQPCPFLHNWGDYIHIVCSNTETSAFISSSKSAVYKFEQVLPKDKGETSA